MIEGFIGLPEVLHEHSWIDDVAHGIAGQISNDPELNAIWIEKWRSCGLASFDAASDCLNSRG